MTSSEANLSSPIYENTAGGALPLPQQVAIHVAAALCSVFTVSANLLVIFLFAYDRKLRTFSNCLILNLAISDVIIGAFSMNVFTFQNAQGHVWPLGMPVCKLWLVVDYVASEGSVLNLLLICVERFIAIKMPLRYASICTIRVAPFVMAAPWGISLLLWGIPILASSYDRLLPGECYIPFLHHNPPVTVVTAVMGFYLPISVMFVLYWSIVREFRRKQRNARQPQSFEEQRRIIVLVKVIVTLFTVLWFPYNVTVVVVAFCGCNVPAAWWSAIYWMCYLNSAVNPVSYGIYNKNFRKSMKRACDDVRAKLCCATSEHV